MELTWRTVHDDAVQLFNGDTPGEALELKLIAHFTEHPQAVQTAINKLARRFQGGAVHSPWPLILRELERDNVRDLVATDNAERTRALRLADTYTRNAGLYNPSPEDHLEDLFGSHGRLRTWNDDQQLQDRYAQLWHDQQPRVEQVRQEAIERAQRWQHAQAALAGNLGNDNPADFG